MAAENAILCVLIEDFLEPDEIVMNTCLKGSYDVVKKNIILCIWCNAMC